MLDLTFGPSFKVKRWFTGFGELSFWWIQICIGSPMRRSSFISIFNKIILILVVISPFIAPGFVYQLHILLPVGVC